MSRDDDEDHPIWTVLLCVAMVLAYFKHGGDGPIVVCRNGRPVSGRLFEMYDGRGMNTDLASAYHRPPKAVRFSNTVFIWRGFKP